MEYQNRYAKTFLFELRQILKSIYWTAYCLWLKNPRLSYGFKSILFVCMGNICRSPFAHYYTMKRLEGCDEISIDSVGLFAKEKNTPPDRAIESANLLGINMAMHIPKPISQIDMERNDIVIVMEPWQRRVLIKKYPGYKQKVFLMSLFLKGTDLYGNGYTRCNILDPYGKDLSVYINSFQRIQAAVDLILAKKSLPL